MVTATKAHAMLKNRVQGFVQEQTAKRFQVFPSRGRG